MRVSVNGQRIRLAVGSSKLLELLRNAGRVLTRGQLIDRIWGADYVGDTPKPWTCTSSGRTKIRPDPASPTA